ncbi:MAG: hypothetical protein EA356_11095 [Geminicoccaceae bacterium]|nr:MAG: hypothetical protein EA356_11095 [Geminicoccaceae bacterium]
MAWLWLLASLALMSLFLALHLLPFSPAARTRAVTAAGGERTYALLFTALSLVALIGAFGLAASAPAVRLWPSSEGLRWLALGLTALAFPLIAAAYVGGEGWRLARHPMLAGVTLWAFAHLIATGTLAAGLVFALVGAYALAAMVLSDRRLARRDAQAACAHFAQSHPVPFWGLVRGDGLGGFKPLALLVGLGLWAAFLAAHPWLFGVSPLPLGWRG